VRELHITHRTMMRMTTETSRALGLGFRV
jgi:hypothetical protein